MSDGVSLDAYRQMMAGQMSEEQLQNVIVAAAQRSGWLVYHTHDSRRSQPGYPDLHLVHVKSGRSLFRELKSEKGRLSTAQVTWIAALTAAGQDVDVWRPIDWYTERIQTNLFDTKTAPSIERNHS